MGRTSQTSGIYIIENTTNGHQYIGSSVDIAQRRRNHLCELRRSGHGNRHLQAAFNKYGESAFKFSTILICELAELRYYEKLIISILQPIYNVARVDELSRWKMADETKLKLSIAHKGKILSEETKRKISANGKGRIVSEETRQKLSQVKVGKSLSAEHCLKLIESRKGRVVSEETKRKTSVAMKGKNRNPLSEETKQKISISLTGRKNGPLSEEHKQKLSASKKGKVFTEEHKQKLSEAARRRCLREQEQLK